ncbi:MAG: hypothetical protein ABSD10_01700 [Candidatus Saccharimonadales bacterium]|jgi:hypothetical protein
MARRKNFSENSPDSLLDVFEAIKRALIRRGFVRHKPVAKLRLPRILRPRELKGIALSSHDVLFKTNTVFPFNIFPDTVTVDREKLTIAHRIFFRVAKITSVPIRDILSVEADVGPFFGSVHTASRYFVTNPYSVNFLWRQDAIRLQRLLQGYIIANEQKIDCSTIEKDKLIAMLNDLGEGDTD